MQNQDLLLLQLLKFPVIIIKFLAKVFSILTYLPNYVVIYFIDSILFNQHLNNTRNRYILSWVPKIVLLGVTVALFGGQFYLIFQVMELSQHGLTIQIIGMILTLAGLLILMRKGYLSMLEKYNLTKLKSPMEHAELGVSLLVDVVGIVLWIVNGIMVINVHRSWDYEYSPDKKYRFIRHISGLIRESLISYLEFFYIKIFFKLFPWRFVREMATYQKEKQQKNVLNCLVLLTLAYLITCLDVLVVSLFGLPCVVHFHRRYYYQSMKKDHEKYKITLREFLFITLQSFQLVIEAVCFVLCWKNGWKAIKTLVKYNQTKQLFGKQFKELIIETLLKIPYLTATLIIAISVYKLKRRNYLRSVKKSKSNKEQEPADVEKSEWQVNDNLQITFVCLGELLLDLCFIPLIILGTVFKPWKYWWFKYIVNPDYTMARDIISNFFFKNLFQLVSLPITILLSFLFFTYDIKKPLRTYRQACEYVDESNKKIDGSAPNPQLDDLAGKSVLLNYIRLSIQCMVVDIPHLPEFFIAKMTFLNLYLPDITPETTPNLFILLQRAYFYLTAKRSARFQEYLAMFNRIKASGGITNIKQEYRFWKYSYKCERLLLVQRIIGLFLPKISVERIKKKIEKPTEFSQISNQYWHQSELTKAMIIRLIYLIIEIILSIIGALFLFPLTLWRIPTFVKLFNFHRARKFFFPILLRVYKQMFVDVIMLPLKIVAMLIAPKMYLSFILKTSFKYGPAGLDTCGLYQRCKMNYFMQNILKANLLGILVHCQVVFIIIFWIRIKSLKMALRPYRLTIFTLYTDRLMASPAVPTMEQMITQPKMSAEAYEKTRDIASFVSMIFGEAVIDLPYLLLILFIFITMPWRITYIIQTIRGMRDDTAQRKSFFKLLKNIFKDYACIFMNILLLVSGFKTKKALFLIKRNYRLNFFKGFLEYSYYNQLIKQIKALTIIYKNVFFLIVAVLFGWTRTSQLVNELQALRKKEKEEEQSSAANKKIYDNTVKSGKQLQTLHKMGYYNYITVCSFLNVPEIIKLKQVDKFNYTMTQRQEIWFMKWESIYSKTSNQASENFQLNCKNAFIAQKNVMKRVTYEQIIMNHFENNVFVESVDLREFLRDKLPQRYYDRIFKNYVFTIVQGYGPENELPQEENEDEEFLRLTNQVRRPIVQLQEEAAWLHLLYFRMAEYLAQKMHRFFREDSHRRKKQLMLIAIIGFTIISLLLFIFLFRGFIFCIDALIAIKLLLCFYYATFVYTMLARCEHLYGRWVSLIPFDIYYDVVDFLKMVKDKIRDYVVIPVKKFIVKCGRFIAKVAKKMMEKGKAIGQVIKEKFCLVCNKVKRVSIRVKNVTVEYSILFYEKVVRPLYISIADKIRKLVQLFTDIFKAIFKSIKSFLIFLGSLFSSFYKAIRAIFSNINKLYYFVLQSSMIFLLRFGFIGNLIFTLFGLVIMTLPSIIWWFFYQKRWYLIASTIHTMVLIVVGYKHLNRIRSSRR